MIVALKYLDCSEYFSIKYFIGYIIITESNKQIELKRDVSLEEAKELGEHQEILWNHQDRTTNKFNTLEQLEYAAIQWCKYNLGEDWILQEKNSRAPHRPIGVSEKYKDIFEKLKNVSIEAIDEHMERRAERKYKKWKKLLSTK